MPYADPETQRAYWRRWKKANPEKCRAYQRRCLAKPASKAIKLANQAKRRAANPERTKRQLRNAKLARRGLTEAEYEKMWKKQKGKCAICKKQESVVSRYNNKYARRLCVDHNHVTLKNRGLLCGRCNIAIGHLFDDPKLC